MLHLLYGPAASGKTDLLMGRIRTAVAARTPGQVLLVPEQYSHEAERALCAACGDSLSLYAEVLSFTGLARRVAAETGAGEAPLLDQGGRLLCMALALLIPFSRLYLGVHTPLDVGVSFVIGWLLVLAFYPLLEEIGHRGEVLERIWLILLVPAALFLLYALRVRAGTSDILLAHLSDENNSPQLAEYTVGRALQASGLSVRLSAAPRDTISEVHVCRRSPSFASEN